jgi:hypothetical protein
MFKRGTIAQNLKTSLESGYRWWNGVEVTSSQYLIYSDTFTLGTTTQANATPVAYSTPDLTDQSLLNLINTLPPRIGQTAFTSLPIALQWLQSSNKFFLIRGGTENIVKSGLISYLDAGRFDSYIGSGTNWVDLSGNNKNGTLNNNVAFDSNGVASMLLDGTDDYISTTTAVNSNTNYTISIVFKIKSFTSSDMRIIGAIEGDSAQLTVGWDNNVLRLWLDNTWNNTTFVSLLDKIYYLTIVHEGTDNKIYVNGVLNDVISNKNSFFNNLGFGQKFVGQYGSYFNGNIYTTQVYNVALSPEQVLQNFNAQKYRFGYYDIVQSGLTFNLDATNYLSYPRSGTTAYDISGYDTKNGTLLNGVNFSGGTVPTFIFDGTDDYIRVSNREDLDFPVANFTAACWFKSTQNSDYIGLLGKIQFGVGTNGWTLEFSNAKVTCWTNSTLIQSPLTYNDGKWHYALMTMGTPSTGQINVYVDGYLVTTAQMHAYTFDPTNLDLWVGGWTNGTSYLLSGEISNAQIYNRVLSPQEVIQNFESQRVNFGTTGITTNGLVLNLDAANTASYGGSGTVWRDISGGGNDGILTNGPTYSNSGASSSIVFDGTNDYAYNSLFSQMSLATNMTISCWCTFADNGSPGRYLWSIGRDIGGVTGGLALMAYGFGVAGGANKLLFELGSAAGRVIYTGTLQQNVWYNFTCTADGTNTKIYVNGNLDNTASQGSGQISSSPGLSVGSYLSNGIPPTPGNFFHNGKISNFLVYNRALSASEILQNHNAQKSRFGL